MKYRTEIDGLRALAVVPVILFHAGFELFSGGFVGVDVFFVISGYLITTILVDDIENNRFSIVNFYERRARRILPALFFVMLVCIPFAWMWMLPSQMKDFSQSLVAVSLFASNILFWKESGYFAAAAEEKPLLHTWSLAVEEQYYVLFPIFLFLVWRFGKNRVFWMIVVFAAISLALSEWGWRNKATANFYLAPARVWELFAGSIAAFIVQKNGVQANNSLSMLGLGAILFAIFAYDESTPFPSVYALVPVVGVVLLVLFAEKETLVAKLLSTKLFVGIGLISYSAYLWHQPLFAFYKILSFELLNQVVMTILSFVSLLLAYFSWRFIERPFRKSGHLSTRNLIYVAGLSGTLLISFGMLGHLTYGSFFRWDADAKALSASREQQEEFVFANKHRFHAADFDKEKTKVLVIGDSNSGDFLNALIESDVENNLSYASLTIGKGCGNLYIATKTIENMAGRSCLGHDYLANESTKDFLRKADWVFLANNWEDWEVELMRESIDKLQKEFGNKFWVVGTKQTMSTNFDVQYLAITKQKIDVTTLEKTESVKINESLSKIVGDFFINPYEWLCTKESCLFVSEADGGVVQYDGFHLTKNGARSFGKWLYATGIPKFLITNK